MRVNHAGEMAAQALYHAQALFARDPEVREFMLHAAREETDHLAWCETRLKELGARPSVLNPLWYAGSFGIGALAAMLGDRASLGFVAETERQVEGHLKSHLEQLPAEDLRSRAIVEAMCHDEVGHGQQAQSAGATPLPGPVRELMRRTASVMTHTSYRI
jgi:ubiquinone biosynthesis monooxygenase Coq7